MTLNIQNCFINASTNQLFLIFEDNTHSQININAKHHNAFMLKMIQDANRIFLCKTFTHNKDQYIEGCLPLKCLLLPEGGEREGGGGEEGEEEKIINPRYLLNTFIHLLELIFSSNHHHHHNHHPTPTTTPPPPPLPILFPPPCIYSGSSIVYNTRPSS